MREILFRGKRIDTEEWVEGNLLHLKGLNGYMNYIIPEVTNGSYDKKDYMLKFISPCFEVDIESICQYTGFTDKNGRKIFDGDIVKRILLPTKRIENYFRVSFVSLKSCFSAIDLNGTNVTFISDYINRNYEIEVIGNIFDNPELLKGCD